MNGGPPLVVPLPVTGCHYDPSEFALCLSCHDASRLFADERSAGVYECTVNPYLNAPELLTEFRNLSTDGLPGALALLRHARRKPGSFRSLARAADREVAGSIWA